MTYHAKLPFMELDAAAIRRTNAQRHAVVFSDGLILFCDKVVALSLCHPHVNKIDCAERLKKQKDRCRLLILALRFNP